MATKATFNNLPELFPQGEPSPYTPSPLESLGDDIDDYSLSLSGSDLSIEGQSGGESVITLPSGGATPVSQTISAYTPTYSSFTNEVIDELIIDITDAGWGGQTSMNIYLPAPTNYEIGATIRVIDYQGSIEDGRNIIFLEGSGENAYSFDNPNLGPSNTYFGGHTVGERNIFRVTSATTYELI